MRIEQGLCVFLSFSLSRLCRQLWLIECLARSNDLSSPCVGRLIFFLVPYIDLLWNEIVVVVFSININKERSIKTVNWNSCIHTYRSRFIIDSIHSIDRLTHVSKPHWSRLIHKNNTIRGIYNNDDDDDDGHRHNNENQLAFIYNSTPFCMGIENSLIHLL